MACALASGNDMTGPMSTIGAGQSKREVSRWQKLDSKPASTFCCLPGASLGIDAHSLIVA